MLKVPLSVWLLSLVSGLMGAWWRIRFLVPLPQVRFFSGHAGLLWANRRWGHLDYDVGGDRASGLPVVIALFLVLYRLFRGLSSGSHSCSSSC